MKDLLEHQTQPTPWSCVHTCLAMVMGVPAQDVIDRVRHDSGMPYLHTIVALKNFGIHFAPLAMPSLWDGWHLVTVPSLNLERSLHAVLLFYSADGEGMRVLDPAIGKRYAEDGSDLKTWSEPVLVRPSGSLEYFDGQ